MVSEVQKEYVTGYRLPIRDDPNRPKCLITKKLIILSTGILLLYSSFEGFKSLPILHKMDPTLGNTCQIVIFISFIFSLMFLPKLTIRKLGCKSTILISCIAYSVFMVSSITSTMWLLLPASVLFGFGASNLWCSVFTYVNEISYVPPGDVLDGYQQAIGSHLFGTFYLFFQLYHILPNLLSFAVKEKSIAANSTGNIHGASKNMLEHVPNISYFCAIKLYGGIAPSMPIMKDHGNFLFFSNFTLSVFAIIFMGLFLEQLHSKRKIVYDARLIADVTATVRQTLKLDQLMLVLISAFIGFQTEFMYREYIQPCPWIRQNSQEYFFFLSIEVFSMCLFMIWVTNYVHRYVVMVPTAVSYVGIIYATSMPCSSDPGYILGVTMVWGICNVIFQTQVTALYGDLFRADQEAGFANFILYVSAGMLSTCTGSFLPISLMKLQFIFLGVGMVGYLIVEFRFHRRTVNGKLMDNVLRTLGEKNISHEKLENKDTMELFSTKEVALIPEMAFDKKPT